MKPGDGGVVGEELPRSGVLDRGPEGRPGRSRRRGPGLKSPATRDQFGRTEVRTGHRRGASLRLRVGTLKNLGRPPDARAGVACLGLRTCAPRTSAERTCEREPPVQASLDSALVPNKPPQAGREEVTGAESGRDPGPTPQDLSRTEARTGATGAESAPDPAPAPPGPQQSGATGPSEPVFTYVSEM